MIFEEHIKARYMRITAAVLLKDAENLEQADLRLAAVSAAQLQAEKYERQLQTLKEELRRSDDLDDQIYYQYYVKHRRPNEVGKIVGYSRASVFRHLKKIKEKRDRIKGEIL